MRLSILILLLAITHFPVHAEISKISASDFIPPVQAQTEDEKQDLLKINDSNSLTKDYDESFQQESIQASNAQDAINAFVQKRQQGTQLFKFKSGFGWISVGAGPYSEMKNVVASRISQREAYVTAFMNAKKSLAETLNGMSHEGKNLIANSFNSINTQEESLYNLQSFSDEEINESVQMLLRGFVVYDVYDDVEEKIVYVSIVTTPRTRSIYQRLSQDTIEASSISESIDVLLSEIKNGLVPPVGSTIITVKNTKEIAFVGYGSSIVRISDNSALQARFNLESEKIAKMRSVDALCGMILGDKTIAMSHLDNNTRSIFKNYDEITKNDPINNTEQNEIIKYKQDINEFINNEFAEDQIINIRKGIMPPGVITRTWRDNDNSTAFGVSVFLPSLSEQAKVDSQAILNPKVINESSADNTKTKQLKQGPSGKVQDDDEL